MTGIGIESQVLHVMKVNVPAWAQCGKSQPLDDGKLVGRIKAADRQLRCAMGGAVSNFGPLAPRVDETISTY